MTLVTWSDFQINNPVAPTADFTIFSMDEKAIGQRRFMMLIDSELGYDKTTYFVDLEVEKAPVALYCMTRFNKTIDDKTFYSYT